MVVYLLTFGKTSVSHILSLRVLRLHEAILVQLQKIYEK